MSSVSKLLWLSCLACAFACTVPTIDTLEEERATECNAEHPCPREDFVCFENRCIRTTGLGCVPGTSRACGSDVGECSLGTSQCDVKGEWGPCVGEMSAVTEVCNSRDDDCDGATDDSPQTGACALTLGVCEGKTRPCVGGNEQACSNASYGPDYESYFEISCDGKDNDCDGSIDEQIVKECAKTVGVCRGSVESCTGGRFEGCTDTTYRAHSPDYQRYETRCDGMDNDCDDKADVWDSIPLVAEHTSEILDAIAVKPTSAPEAVLTLTGESNGLVARTFTGEGLLNTGAKFPAPASNVQFLAPALAEERDTVVAAWIERTTTGSASTYRVLMTLLDGTGNRIANVPIHNVSPYNDGKTRPSRLWLAINVTHILLVLETLPDGFGARELWALTVMREDLRVRSTPLKLGGSSSSHWGPALTPNFARNSFLVAYEDSSGVPKVGSLSNEGVLSTVPGPAVGSFAHSPFIVPTDTSGSYTLYYVNWPDTASESTTLMLVNCSSTGCGALKPIHTYFHHIRSMQMVTRPGMRTPELALLRWEDNTTATRGLSVALFPSGNFTKIADPLRLGAERTYSEVLALPPSGGPRLVYLQEAPQPTTLAIGGVRQANLRPFCP